MNGELSIKHLSLESKCKVCHVPWKGVNNEICSKCHYDDKHYVKYVKKDLTQTNGHTVKKIRCFDCHREHRGRSYNIRWIKSTSLSPYNTSR